MLSRGLVLGAVAAIAAQSAQAVAVYGQCGGQSWTGSTVCDSGSYCSYSNPYYSQCLPGTASATTSATTTKASTTTTTKVSTTTTKASTATTTKASTTSTTSTTSVVSTTSTTTSASATPTSLRGLHALAKAHGRYFGTATDQLWTNTDTAYLTLTGNSSEFGANTPGNQQKWDATEKSRGVFTFTNGDYEVAWAKNHSQIVRGHTLVWYSQLPTWVSSGGFDNATLISIMENHIANVVGHYKGKVYSWDVVNELWNEDGTYRTNVFYDTIGPAYVPIAMRAARAADPNAKLYINDYNTDWTGSKSDAMYALAQSLIAQGVPLDGIGFQAHLIVDSFYRTFQANYERFAALGLDVAITELDIRMTLPATDALLASQAENYQYVVNACLAVSRCVGITTWDTSDDYSWIPSVFSGQGAALLFDANKKPKPAYYTVANALAAATVKGTWA